MALIDFKTTLFNSLCGVFTFFGVGLSYFFFHYSVLLSIFFLIISLLSLCTLIGSFFAFHYVEGCVVRLLMQHGGTLSREQLRECHSGQGGIELVLSSLASRDVVSVENEMLTLNTAVVNRGVLNTIMMWSTRKHQDQSLGHAE